MFLEDGWCGSKVKMCKTALFSNVWIGTDLMRSYGTFPLQTKARVKLQAAGDKLARVRQFYKMINERFLKSFQLEENLCVDQAMITYHGKHSAKQYIKGKPIMFGYKLWCLRLSCSVWIILWEKPNSARAWTIDYCYNSSNKVVVRR